MAGSVSKTILIGNVGKDPELKSNGGGKTFAVFSVATSESWRDKDSGERKERTEWHNIVVFEESLVRIAEHQIKKGSKVYIEGQNRTRKWKDRDGNDRYTTEVVLQGFAHRLEPVDRMAGSGGPPPPDSEDDYGSTRSRSSANSSGFDAGGMDDDIPF